MERFSANGGSHFKFCQLLLQKDRLCVHTKASKFEVAGSETRLKNQHIFRLFDLRLMNQQLRVLLLNGLVMEV